MVWRVFHSIIHMAREVPSRNALCITLCRESDTTHFLREYIMNLFDLNSDKIIYNIDGRDIEMKPAICFDKVYDKWMVSKCGKVWSLKQKQNRILGGQKTTSGHIQYQTTSPIDFWEDGSGYVPTNRNYVGRKILAHKLVIDTWKPLYDNPPEGIVWEEWEIVRDLPSVYNHISKTVWIDHIDDNPTNNHLDNLRRVTSWDNHYIRKARGI